MSTRWLWPEPHHQSALTSVARRLGLRTPIGAAIVINRGLLDDGIDAFLRPDLSQLHDPADLANLRRAVSVLDVAIRAGSRIVVYGDYDVDGITSTALLVSYLRSRGANVGAYVPLRHEGYGLSKASIDWLLASPSERRRLLEHRLTEVPDESPEAEAIRYRLEHRNDDHNERPALIITVDCGTSSRSEVSYARSKGVEVIVTDHHRPTPGKETIGLVVNPNAAGDPSPNKGLAGVGVAYKLVAGHFGRHPTANLDLVAMGTIADVMPLTGENRILVKMGLQRLGHTARPGLAALLDAVIEPVPCRHGATRCYPVTSSDVAYAIGPRINAISRMGLDPILVVDLLTLPDTGADTAAEIVAKIERANQRRKELTNDAIDTALAMIDLDDPVIVLQMAIPRGLAGLVAGRLATEFRRPAIVVDESGHGSARSPDGIDLLSVLQTECADIVTAAGHAGAMGIADLHDPSALRARLAHRIWPDDLGLRHLVIDAVCALGDCDDRLIDDLEQLEPTGRGNPPPVIAIPKVEVVNVSRSKDGRHAFLVVRDGSASRRVAWFGGGREAIEHGAVIDLAGRPVRRYDPMFGTSVEFVATAIRPFDPSSTHDRATVATIGVS
jgi:single-stranded-DNA-specific exonuclease